MSDAPLCHYEVSEGVALLTLNRPNRLNAMTGEMEIEVYERLLEADAAPDVRAIVITGAGAGFCVGADLVAVNEPDAEPLPNTRLPATTLLDIRKPMIAAINGSCAGWGFAFAMHCDYRFAAENVKFTTAGLLTSTLVISHTTSSWASNSSDEAGM